MNLYVVAGIVLTLLLWPAAGRAACNWNKQPDCGDCGIAVCDSEGFWDCAPKAVRGRSTERAARDFARLPGLRSRAASCQNEAYPTSPSRPPPSLSSDKARTDATVPNSLAAFLRQNAVRERSRPGAGLAQRFLARVWPLHPLQEGRRLGPAIKRNIGRVVMRRADGFKAAHPRGWGKS